LKKDPFAKENQLSKNSSQNQEPLPQNKKFTTQLKQTVDPIFSLKFIEFNQLQCLIKHPSCLAQSLMVTIGNLVENAQAPVYPQPVCIIFQLGSFRMK
jgi:hypothetical protein